MVLIHDHDLMMIPGIGRHGTVSGLLDIDNSCIVHAPFSVTGNPRTRCSNGPPSEIQHTDASYVW
jgi:hypothetical protein